MLLRASPHEPTVLNKVCAELQDCTLLRSSGRRGATSSFMTSLLRSVGLQHAQLSLTEQENLLTVFVEHQKTKGRRVVVAVDAAETLTLEDWQELERLHTLQLENRAILELIIVGRPDICRHIQSPVEGWQCARTTFHTLRTIEDPMNADGVATRNHLIVSRDGEVINRAPLETRTLIGRDEHNDICLQHPSVSRHHAVIVGTPSGYYVVDLNSKNGLTVNGALVANTTLRNNDRVTLGPYRIKVVVGGDELRGDPRPSDESLSATTTLRVKKTPSSLRPEPRSVGKSVSSRSDLIDKLSHPGP